MGGGGSRLVRLRLLGLRADPSRKSYLSVLSLLDLFSVQFEYTRLSRVAIAGMVGENGSAGVSKVSVRRMGLNVEQRRVICRMLEGARTGKRLLGRPKEALGARRVAYGEPAARCSASPESRHPAAKRRGELGGEWQSFPASLT